jgi:hypothetical protein
VPVAGYGGFVKSLNIFDIEGREWEWAAENRGRRSIKVGDASCRSKSGKS